MFFEKNEIIINVANRMPVTLKRNEEKKYVCIPSSGGLATALSKLDCYYVGWPGVLVDNDPDRQAINNVLAAQKMIPVYLTRDEVEYYYEGFCNRLLWMLMHNEPDAKIASPYFEAKYWDYYKQVNRKFALAIMGQVGAIKKNPSYNNQQICIWLHDIHLMLAPTFLRNMLNQAGITNVKVGFFSHIPFPDPKVIMSECEVSHASVKLGCEIIDGLAAGLGEADLVGFHIDEYKNSFLQSMKLRGKEKLFDASAGGTTVDVFPIGIDYKQYCGKQFPVKPSKEKTILSVQRLDPSKGMLQQLKTYHNLLSCYQRQGKPFSHIKMKMIAVPSRMEVPEYQSLAAEVAHYVAIIHRDFGRQSLEFINKGFAPDVVIEMYQQADVCFVGPTRDGMNLVAKEYVAAHDLGQRGVLVLSENTGAAKQLSDKDRGALGFDPKNYITSATVALDKALNMSSMEQAQRMQFMQKSVKKYDVSWWAKKFIDMLALSGKKQSQVLQSMGFQFSGMKVHNGNESTPENANQCII